MFTEVNTPPSFTSGFRYQMAIAGLCGIIGVPGSNAISICLSMCSSGISSSIGTFIGPVAEEQYASLSLTSKKARTLRLKAAREVSSALTSWQLFSVSG